VINPQARLIKKKRENKFPVSGTNIYILTAYYICKTLSRRRRKRMKREKNVSVFEDTQKNHSSGASGWLSR